MVDLGQRRGLDRPERGLAGVADQRVGHSGGGDRSVDRSLVRDVEPQADLGGQVGQRLGVAGGGDDAMAACGQLSNGGAADAFRRPGDEHSGHDYLLGEFG